MQNRRVLVVDDQQPYLEWVSEAVTACELEPVQANGFNAAARLLTDETFTLVITDNYMPHRDEGIELLQYMNRRSKTETPTILHSNTPPQNLKMLLEAFPWVTFVQKDSDWKNETLVKTINELLP